MRLCTLICAASILLGNTGHAATFTAISTVGNLGCDDRNSNSSGATASCSAFANAASEGGRLGVFAFSQRSTSAAPVMISDSGLASSTAIFTDELTFGISDGFLVLPVDLAGSFQADAEFDTDGAFAILQAEIRTNSSPGFSFSGNVSNPTAGTFVQDVMLPFSGNSLTLTAILAAQARAGFLGFGENETRTATVDFGSSLRLLGATILDIDENVVDTTLISASGFDYLTGFEPHGTPDPISPVPLPASAWMLLAALGGMFRLNQVRSRKSMA